MKSTSSSASSRTRDALKYLRPSGGRRAPWHTLGGGVEVCFPADQVQAAAETYMGLVEVGVGLIPGGGGNKELLFRCDRKCPKGQASTFSRW